MKKVVLVGIGPLAKFGIESGQRTLQFKKKDYDFEQGDVIAFYYPMNGMEVLMHGCYEVKEIDYGRQGQCALVSFRKMRDYEDE